MDFLHKRSANKRRTWGFNLGPAET
jgi:hypothetical protein